MGAAGVSCPVKGRDKQNRVRLIGSEHRADGLGAAGTFFGQGLMKASSISLHFAGFFVSFLIVSGGCITFVLFKSCPRVQSPIKKVTYQRGLGSVGLIHHFKELLAAMQRACRLRRRISHRLVGV